MRNLTTHISSGESAGLGAPRSGKDDIGTGRGCFQTGLYQPGPARDWSGLHDRHQRFELNHDRVAIQRILRHGRAEDGSIIGVNFHPPEFVSSARAQQLIRLNLAKFAGITST